MGWTTTPYTIPLAISTVVALSLAAYGYRSLDRHGREPSLVAFTVLMACNGWWSLVYGIQLSSTDEATKVLLSVVNVGPLLGAAAWLAFALAYTGNEEWLDHPLVWIAVGFAVLSEFVVEPTNPIHGWLASDWHLEPVGGFSVLVPDPGWLYWVTIAWGYGIVLVGMGLFVRMAIRSHRTYRAQAAAAIAGTLIPLAVNAAFVAGLTPHRGVNFTSMAFTASGVIYGYAVFRYKLLDVAPVARDRVVERMRDGYLVVDAEDRIIDLNPAACRFLDVAPDDAIGASARTVLPRIAEHSDADARADPGDGGPSPPSSDGGTLRWAESSRTGDSASGGPGETQTGAAPTASDPLSGSWEFAVEVDGERRYVEADGSPLRAEDRPVGRLVVLRDVTGRRRVEKRYQALIEHASDLITVVDRDGHVVFQSPSIRRILGIDPGAVRGTDLFEHVHPEDRGRLRETFEAVVSEAGASERVEYRMRDADADWRVLEAIATNLLETPFVGGVVINARDVTERKERERALQRQNERLDEFASVVSHDLRNPLSVAQGYLAAARESPTSDVIDEVETSLDRMEAIIDDVLTLARQGEEVGDTEPVDLETVAYEAWGHVDTPAATLSVSADREVAADRARLLQLFENLFRNSVEHGPEDVTVTVGALADGAGFFVADDGPGIPPDEHVRVFESGYTTREAGTGFGLAIVERIAAAHGWSVAVTDAADGGARFEIRD